MVIEPARPLLAIEMSQRGGSVALGTRGDSLRSVRFESGGSRDDDPLLPAIDGLVRGAGLAPRDLGAIAVSVGPGGFTGLRIAVTATKCMCEALRLPAIAVPSALVAARGAKNAGAWLVALASKRETTWMTRVIGDGDELRIADQPGVVTATGLVAPAGFRTLLADEHVHGDIITWAKANGLNVEAPSFDAESCWGIAVSLLERGECVDHLQLVPLYPREPEAVTLWRTRHGEPDAR